MDINAVIQRLEQRDPHDTHFRQAAKGLLGSLDGYLKDHPEIADSALLERLLEPERTVIFRVTWVDDHGATRVNRGYRVQMNGALGPYKGGLRFHPSVNLDILRFLALEQTIKNALTGLPLGAGKGGSDFDPKGRSDGEIMRFCQAFMSELYRHIGPDIDVPAGDMGVGTREVGYLFGMYRKLSGTFSGTLTGKGPTFGGSALRPEATGYGLVYFAQQALRCQDDTLEGKAVAVSGAGSVARHAALKAIEMGARVVTLSDSRGLIHRQQGFDAEQVGELARIKANGGGVADLAGQATGVSYHENEKPWARACDVALPCATQNELDQHDARALVKGGCRWLLEGANMPCTAGAVAVVREAGLGYAPGKAANAGGVAVSGLEMSQNSLREYWSASEVDRRLYGLMENIHRQCVEHGGGDHGGPPDYETGAAVAGFSRVAEAMRGQGIL
ncbi:NADP-specific glutamate dehydrogenase [Alloalcanivorax mobilis]|uniref:NADP-specific glutamate dehydrogenase n=1 Tax=Alloalcanivorax mobilis TaxID=2019569 RepID=UPI000C755D66|nr:NADP-specific glutamate dehydrogenase [Alloalcanivorax mobilis]